MDCSFRIFGDERPPVLPTSDDVGLDDVLMLKTPRPRKTRPPPKFDMAADLLMGGSREREVIKTNNGAYIPPAVEDVQDAD